MKNLQKITRIHLSANNQEKPLIFGIVTADPDYKISLKLNRKLKIYLKNSEPLEIYDDEGYKSVFTRFSDPTGAPSLIFQLISNRSEKTFLIKKVKNIDYFLLVNNSGKNFRHEEMLSLIREIDTVTGIFIIDSKRLKDKNLNYLI